MEQVYYTQEGSKYVLKSITKVVDSVIIAVPGIDQNCSVVVNASQAPVPLTQPWNFIELVTSRPFVPVLTSLAWVIDDPVLSFHNPTIDFTTPFYGFFLDNVKAYKHLAPLSKIVPNLEKLDFTNEKLYHYGVKYNQVVLSNDDFINPNGAIAMPALPYYGNATTDTFPTPGTHTVPAGTYKVAITFTYFELQ